jgi:hypothetical protein
MATSFMASTAPATSTASTSNTPGDFNTFLNQVLPGASDLTTSGTDVIQNMLNGLPSVSNTRTANAYFGANSGMGAGSEFLRNRGYDLYNQKAQAQQQTGLQDLMSMIQGYSAPALQYQGQQLQNQQFGQSQAQQLGEFTQSQAQQLQEANAKLDADKYSQELSAAASQQWRDPTFMNYLKGQVGYSPPKTSTLSPTNYTAGFNMPW